MMMWSLLLIAMGWSMACAQQSGIPTVSPEEVFRRLKDTSIVVLDVRTPAEFAEGHIPGARLIPVQELEQRLRELEPVRNKTVIAYCRSGGRSAYATQLLQRHGFKVFSMRGGILEWQRQKYPTATPQSPPRRIQ
ncbi:MAG: rhodanese-like domain-containing protein [Candidatus Kapabacteria bacterium]|nr:rhodanese-like domain-containing protein [Candidatus Kapabacteria bacterium]MDW8012678.1 rhodanese-like domain-containing protein [Bacteroidota bacterium]